MTLHLSEKEAARLGANVAKQKRTRKAKPVTLLCGCGETFIGARRDAPRCPKCRHERKKERGRNWGARNYVRRDRYPDLSDPRVLSDGERQNIAWYSDGPPDLLWQITLAIPYSSHMSKNKLLGRTRSGVYMRKEAHDQQGVVMTAFADALRLSQRTVVRAKLWIDIFVQKPNHYSDAVNVVDSICDALKAATNLDDRWFSISRLDWEVVTDDPFIFIGIGQDTEENHGICQYCKRMLPFSMFRKSTTGRNGTTGRCIECRIPKKA